MLLSLIVLSVGLQRNSLEQLCINYANEKMAQFFFDFALDMEQAVHGEEGIAWYVFGLVLCFVVRNADTILAPSLPLHAGKRSSSVTTSLLWTCLRRYVW